MRLVTVFLCSIAPSPFPCQPKLFPHGHLSLMIAPFALLKVGPLENLVWWMYCPSPQAPPSLAFFLSLHALFPGDFPPPPYFRRPLDRHCPCLRLFPWEGLHSFKSGLPEKPSHPLLDAGLPIREQAPLRRVPSHTGIWSALHDDYLRNLSPPISFLVPFGADCVMLPSFCHRRGFFPPSGTPLSPTVFSEFTRTFPKGRHLFFFCSRG